MVFVRTTVAFSMLAAPFFAHAEQGASEPKRRCLGVVVESKNGPYALLGLKAAGDEAAIDKFIAAASAIGVDGIQKSESGNNWTVQVAFPSPPVTARKVADLVERTRAGEFGRVMLTPYTMGVEVLSPEKCPDAYL